MESGSSPNAQKNNDMPRGAWYDYRGKKRESAMRTESTHWKNLPWFAPIPALCLFIFPTCAGALNITNTDGVVYQDAIVVSKNPTGIIITYTEKGKTKGTNLQFSRLAPDIQRMFSYSPEQEQKYKTEREERERRAAAVSRAQQATRPAGETPKTTAPPALTAGPAPKPPTERQYRSEHPLYFRVAFGDDGNPSMLGVADESQGTGTAYDTVYLDENMNNDLSDEQPRLFSKLERVRENSTGFNPQIDFKGPQGKNGNVSYSLNIYDLEYKKTDSSRHPRVSYFMWRMTINDWHYMFINGRMQLYSSAVAALQEKPALLGGKCSWEISSRAKDQKVFVDAALKDENGCKLRSVGSQMQQTLSPMLTLKKDGSVALQEKMEFG